MTWEDGGEGPACSCGEVTVVRAVGVKRKLKAVCLFHTADAGLIFDLPEEA